MKTKTFYETGRESYLLDEFKPYRKDGRYYHKRVIRIWFFPTATMKVQMIDFHDKGEDIILQQYIKYDDCGESITPTGMQGLEMQAIANGEISGEYAESIIHNLFVDLCLLNPKSKFSEYFPKVIEKLLDKDMYNYTLLSK